MRVGADLQARDVDAALGQPCHLAEQDPRIDDDPIADDRYAVRPKHAARDEVQGVRLRADDHRVAGVIAALVAHDIVDPATEQVGGLSLALIAPLGTDEHDSWHVGRA